MVVEPNAFDDDDDDDDSHYVKWKLGNFCAFVRACARARLPLYLNIHTPQPHTHIEILSTVFFTPPHSMDTRTQHGIYYRWSWSLPNRARERIVLYYTDMICLIVSVLTKRNRLFSSDAVWITYVCHRGNVLFRFQSPRISFESLFVSLRFFSPFLNALTHTHTLTRGRSSDRAPMNRIYCNGERIWKDVRVYMTKRNGRVNKLKWIDEMYICIVNIIWHRSLSLMDS